jgi:hypothetical protein
MRRGENETLTGDHRAGQLGETSPSWPMRRLLIGIIYRKVRAYIVAFNWCHNFLTVALDTTACPDIGKFLLTDYCRSDGEICSY